jgi:hypothetical protein
VVCVATTPRNSVSIDEKQQGLLVDLMRRQSNDMLQPSFVVTEWHERNLNEPGIQLANQLGWHIEITSPVTVTNPEGK